MADLVMVKHPVGFVWMWEDDILKSTVPLERVRPDRYIIPARFDRERLTKLGLYDENATCEYLIYPNQNTIMGDDSGRDVYFSTKAMRERLAPWLVERGSH